MKRLFRSHLVERLEPRRMLSTDGTAAAQGSAEVETKISDLKAYFDEVMATRHAYFLDLSIAGGANSHTLYNLQLALDGVTSMYEATGDLAVLQKAVEYATNIMDGAHVIPGGKHEADGYLDWEALRGSGPRSPREGLSLNDLQIGSALSRLGRVVKEDVRLQDLVEIQDFGTRLVDFVDRHVVTKWLEVRGLSRWMRDRHDVAGYWDNRMTHTINICHNLSTVLGDTSSCAGIEAELAGHFKSLLVVQDDGAYVWDTFTTLPAGNHHLAPDTSHQNRVATMIAQLGADGFVFDRTDIDRLSQTFTQRIWNGKTDWSASPGIQDSPWFHNYVDGSDASYRTYTLSAGPEGMAGFVYDGWVRLGQFNPEVQAAGEALLDFIRAFPSNVNAIRQRNGSVFGKIALAGHLARNLRCARDPVQAAAQTNQSTDAVFATPEPLAGDADRDGEVTFADFLALARNFGRMDASWEDGDFNGDQEVTLDDFLALAENFGKRRPL